MLIAAVEKAGYHARPFEDRATAEAGDDAAADPRVKAVARERNLALLALVLSLPLFAGLAFELAGRPDLMLLGWEIGRAAGRARVCQYVLFSVVAGSIKKKNKTRNP